MEINNILSRMDSYRAGLEKTEKRDDGSETSDKVRVAKQSAQGDRISVSPEARLRTEAYAAAMNAPELRRAKVDAVKAQLEAGEYRIDSRVVAEKLLREEPGLFGG
jgi:negative regulator of flagellin synthesis FlgM